VTYSASGLPTGLQVNAATGLISGIPGVAGTFPVQVTASNSGGSGSASLTLTISAVVISAAPKAVITVTPQSGTAPLTLTCDASQSTGGNLTYGWNFGDHSTTFGPVVTHTYSQPGVYSITVTVSNNLGNDRARFVIIINGN
jgi:PKD repeat protein